MVHSFSCRTKSWSGWVTACRSVAVSDRRRSFRPENAVDCRDALCNELRRRKAPECNDDRRDATLACTLPWRKAFSVLPAAGFWASSVKKTLAPLGRLLDTVVKREPYFAWSNCPAWSMRGVSSPTSAPMATEARVARGVLSSSGTCSSRSAGRMSGRKTRRSLESGCSHRWAIFFNHRLAVEREDGQTHEILRCMIAGQMTDGPWLLTWRGAAAGCAP